MVSIPDRSFKVRKMRVILCAIFLLMTFRVLQFIPVAGQYLREGWIAIVLLMVTYLVLFRKTKKIGKYFSSFIFFSGCVVLLSVYTAIRATVLFEQPLSLIHI